MIDLEDGSAWGKGIKAYSNESTLKYNQVKFLANGNQIRIFEGTVEIKQSK